MSFFSLSLSLSLSLSVSLYLSLSLCLSLPLSLSLHAAVMPEGVVGGDAEVWERSRAQRVGGWHRGLLH